MLAALPPVDLTPAARGPQHCRKRKCASGAFSKFSNWNAVKRCQINQSVNELVGWRQFLRQKSPSIFGAQLTCHAILGLSERPKSDVLSESPLALAFRTPADLFPANLTQTAVGGTKNLAFTQFLSDGGRLAVLQATFQGFQSFVVQVNRVKSK